MDAKKNPELLRILSADLRKYGLGRFPALRNEMEDIASDAIADLIKYLEEASVELTNTSVRKLAFTIFKRRAIDAFRRRAKELNMQAALAETDQHRTSPHEGEKSLLVSRMLMVCVRFLSEASPEDRRVFAVAAGLDPSHEGVLNDRDRQRLHRLRARLSLAIRQELGEDAGSLLTR